MTDKNPKILCLDDRVDNLRIRKMLLEQFGCDVVTVTSGQECLQAASAEPFDLVLLDYHLDTEMDGEQVAKDLHAYIPSVPLVMLTGDPGIPESAKACVDAVLIKGESNPGDLLRTIQSLLPRYDLRERHELIVSSLFPEAKDASADDLSEVRKRVAPNRSKAPAQIASFPTKFSG